jgi:hypothetical protein
MEVKVTVDFSDRAITCLNAVVDALCPKTGFGQLNRPEATVTGSINTSEPVQGVTAEPAPTHKRTTKKATTKVDDATAEGAAPAAPSESQEQEQKGELTMADLRPAMKVLWDADKKQDLADVFAKYQVKGLKDLDPGVYADVLAEFTRIAEAYGL